MNQTKAFGLGCVILPIWLTLTLILNAVYDYTTRELNYTLSLVGLRAHIYDIVIAAGRCGESW